MEIKRQDFIDMTEQEKESYFFSVLGITKDQLAGMIAEFEYQENKSPNAIMISDKTLIHFSRIGVVMKKFIFGAVNRKRSLTMTVLPLADAEEGKIILCEADPWDPRWEHLFFS